MEQQRHAERYRLGEVDDPPQFGIAQDAAGVTQVAGDEDHVGQAVKVSAATREHDRAIVNVVPTTRTRPLYVRGSPDTAAPAGTRRHALAQTRNNPLAKKIQLTGVFAGCGRCWVRTNVG